MMKLCSIFVICLSLAFAVLSKPSSNLLYANTTPRPVIQAPAAVLMDANSGAVIYSRNMDIAYYPASITKIMSALVAIELAEGDFEQRVQFSHNAVMSIPFNAAHIGMNYNESLSLWEALMGHMLMSANEVSNAIAEHFSVTTEEFSRLMSERAREIGALNTNFTNPHGLHGAGHYTTAFDMALIMREAIKHPEFVDIISTVTFQIPPTERHSQPRDLTQHHRMIRPSHYFYRDYVVGGKTGFTNQARNTLVTYAAKDGMSLIAVVLYNDGATRSYEDTAALFEFGFNMFGQVKIFDANDFSAGISVMSQEGGSAYEADKVDVYARESVLMNLPININAQNIQKIVSLPDYLIPPVREGDRVGSLDIMYMNSLLATVPLFAADYSAAPVYTISPTGGGARLVTPFTAPFEEFGGFDLQTILLTGFAGLFILASFYILIERRRRKRARRLKVRLREKKLRNKYPSPYGQQLEYKTRARRDRGVNYRYRTDGR